MLGSNLITKQTGSRGRRCDKVTVKLVCNGRSASDVSASDVLLTGISSGEDADLVGVLLCSGYGQSIQSKVDVCVEKGKSNASRTLLWSKQQLDSTLNC